MLLPGTYEYVCKNADEIPKAAYIRFPQDIGRAVGEPVSVVLPELAKSFPLTVAAMEAHWPRPEAVFKRVIGEWLGYLVLERPDLNMFFKLNVVGTPIEGPEFDLDHCMLPPAWRELYRRLDSFVITDRSVVSLGWKNTPFSYSARLTLEEYRQCIGAKESAIRGFEEYVGSDQLMCWLWTEDGDALFLDEAHNDHKVYHVQFDAFADAYVLPNPGACLDHYLEHVVAGRPVGAFDFRCKPGSYLVL